MEPPVSADARQAALQPAVVTVGDELIFGEHQNQNQRWLLQLLWEKGHPARVAITLPDAVEIIAFWLRQFLQAQYYPVLVSGGIGGTHDDCTREAIARALDLPLVRSEECFNILAAKYGERFSSGRQRMALLPAGCELIANPIGAPGFAIEGIWAFPGFPVMLQPMVLQVLEGIFSGPAASPWCIREVTLPVSEGDIAWVIESFAKSHRQTRIGIYPHAQKFRQEVTVRLRCPSEAGEIISAFDNLIRELKHKHGIAP
jgi:molybdenum cofactor synthesis domain-containing protein